MMTIDEQLRFAIAGKRLVQLSYKESLRVAEPHDYGVKKGVVRLFAYQLQASPGWRWFDIEKIAGLAVLDDVFKGSRGTAHERHHEWDVVYARVK